MITKVIVCIIFAQLGRVGSLLEIPVANFRSSYIPLIEVSSNISFALNSNDKHPVDMDYTHINVYLWRNLGIGFNYFTRNEVGFDVIYRIVTGSYIPNIAVGFRNITYKRYISPAGGDPPDGGFTDENYTGKKYRIPELLSFFVVISRQMQNYTFHLGLGRGEFIGYGPRSKYLNFDIFSKSAHELILGFFFGVEYVFNLRNFFLSDVKYALEIDGRDLNMGFKGKWRNFEFALEFAKLEHVILKSKLFPRIGFSVSYTKLKK